MIYHQFKYRGLWIEATFSEMVPSTWMDPPEGVELQSMTWDVEDLDELIGWLDISTEEDEALTEFFTNLGYLPNHITTLIETTWDLEQAATEDYYDH